MKRSKKLLGLLIVLALFMTAAYIATIANPENKADAATTVADTKYTILSIDSDNITSISWNYAGSALTFTCEEDTWDYAYDDAFPLDVSYITAMLASLNNIEASKTIEDVTDLNMYGLASPTCSISVEADSTYYIQIGNETAMDGLRYVSIGDDNVYLVEETLLNNFAYELYDLLLKESIPEITDILNVSIVSETNSLLMEYLPNSNLSYSNEYVWFLKENDGYLTLDTELTEALISNITELSFLECINYNATDEELASYGLLSPMITASVNYTNDSADCTFTILLGDYTDGSKCYARIAGSRMVYLVNGTVSDTFMYAGYERLQPDEVLIMDWDSVTKVIVNLDGTDYTFNKTSKPVIDEDENVTEKIIYTLNGSEASIESILTGITSLASTDFSNGTVPERNAWISFKIYRDTEYFKETVLTFYQYDSTSCLVALNGETTVFVAREDISAIVEAINTIILKQ